MYGFNISTLDLEMRFFMTVITISKEFNKTIYTILIFLIILLAFSNPVFGNDIGIDIINPYEEIDWNSINYYKANLHTHTRQSDGFHSPMTVVNEYRKNNYDILAITDHNKYTWPWNKFGINYKDINITAVDGSEISNAHHLGSYFNEYASDESSEEKVLNEIEKRDGLAVFFHPGRYNKTIKWYGYYYKKYDNLIGIEVFNKNDRYPKDRELWDRLLFELMPDNPVWGFGNDDMHNIATDFGWHYNIFLMSENNRTNIKNAMQSGHFYVYNPSEQKEKTQFYIKEIKVKDLIIELSIKGNYNKIEWIAYNTISEKSEILATGNTIDTSKLIYKTNYIRAKIISNAGLIYTQPFGIRF